MVCTHAEKFLRTAQPKPEAGNHLVKNQQCTVPVTQPAQPFQKARCGRHDPHIRRNRLYDHRRDLPRIGLKQGGNGR